MNTERPSIGIGVVLAPWQKMDRTTARPPTNPLRAALAGHRHYVPGASSPSLRTEDEGDDGRIDEALIESFPASDPPPWTLGGWHEHTDRNEDGTSNASRHAHLHSSILIQDLAVVAERLRTQPTFRQRGHNAATLVKHADQRVLLLVLRSAAHIHEHKAAGAVSIQVLSGRVRLRISDETVEPRAGHLLALEGGLLHDIEGVEEASLLITLSWSPSRASRDP